MPIVDIVESRFIRMRALFRRGPRGIHAGCATMTPLFAECVVVMLSGWQVA